MRRFNNGLLRWTSRWTSTSVEEVGGLGERPSSASRWLPLATSFRLPFQTTSPFHLQLLGSTAPAVNLQLDALLQEMAADLPASSGAAGSSSDLPLPALPMPDLPMPPAASLHPTGKAHCTPSSSRWGKPWGAHRSLLGDGVARSRVLSQDMLNLGFPLRKLVGAVRRADLRKLHYSEDELDEAGFPK